ncbi:YycC family protein [Paenibacillus sp. S150]|uniref:YycC family protein n=1 Tax=Paenibacillus sp. S150 TaxID=2749826 RepID=UPI001C56CC72|nr:YycC family protein [Paenibacillus sp. S150]MBW4080931.1 YycC family protein [Paenibacillus sp. S150]
MKPLQISPETAIALSKQLGVPLEHLMHMPQHILLQKIAELSKKQNESTSGSEAAPLPPEKGEQ